MKNSLLRYVLLEEMYGCKVSLSELRDLFGRRAVNEFLQKSPEFCQYKGFVGRCEDNSLEIRRKISNGKITIAKRWFNWVRNVPWVRFVGVSGSVAFTCAKEEDDIDIFIVVQKHRIWIVRALLTTVFSLFRVRRSYGATSFKDLFCLNLFVSEDTINLKKMGRANFSTALELIKVVPIVHKDFMQTMLNENSWIKEYFPGVHIESGKKYELKRRIPVISVCVDLLDTAARLFQIMYMKIRNHPYQNCFTPSGFVHFFVGKNWENRDKKFKKVLEKEGCEEGEQSIAQA